MATIRTAPRACDPRIWDHVGVLCRQSSGNECDVHVLLYIHTPQSMYSIYQASIVGASCMCVVLCARHPSSKIIPAPAKAAPAATTIIFSSLSSSYIVTGITINTINTSIILLLWSDFTKTERSGTHTRTVMVYQDLWIFHFFILFFFVPRNISVVILLYFSPSRSYVK